MPSSDPSLPRKQRCGRPAECHDSRGGTLGADVRLVLEPRIVLRQILLVVAGVIARKHDRRGYRDFGAHGVVAMHTSDNTEDGDRCRLTNWARSLKHSGRVPTRPVMSSANDLPPFERCRCSQLRCLSEPCRHRAVARRRVLLKWRVTIQQVLAKLKHLLRRGANPFAHERWTGGIGVVGCPSTPDPVPVMISQRHHLRRP
jgi:hypothetical protein